MPKTVLVSVAPNGAAGQNCGAYCDLGTGLSAAQASQWQIYLRDLYTDTGGSARRPAARPRLGT